MNKQRMHGFTIAEMAVVVVVMAVVMTSSLKLLNSQLSNAAIQQTRDKQAEIRRALVHFLRTNGRLPCPDTKRVPATPPPDGLEVAPCFATSEQGFGVVPWQTLGLGRDRAIDGWGSYMSYRVANGLHGPLNSDWTSNTLLYSNTGTFSIGEFTAPKVNLTVQERNPSAPGFPLTPVSSRAVVVLVSYGKAAWGAVRQGGVVEPTSTAPDEAQNATSPFTTFITRPLTLWPWDPASAGEFDDMVSFMTPLDLIDPLVQEKTLKGSCQAYCTAPAPQCFYSGSPIGQAGDGLTTKCP